MKAECSMRMELKALNEDERKITGIVSKPEVDSKNEIIEPEAIRKALPSFMASNPMLTYGHNLDWPIGKITNMQVNEKGETVLEAQLLPPGDELADKVWHRVKAGVVNGLSIGFIPDYEAADIEGGVFRWKAIKRIIEVALTPVPVLQSAKLTEVKSIVPFQDLPLADPGLSWSARDAEKRVAAWAGWPDDMDWKKYRKAFVWYDAENPKKKSSYKLQIADIVDGELRVVWRAVAAAMASLLGARGGVDIPETEKKRAYNVLVKYYKKFDKPAPEFHKSFTDVEFKAGEQRIFEEVQLQEHLNRLKGGVESIKSLIAHWGKQGVDLAGPYAEAIEAVTKSVQETLEQLRPAGSTAPEAQQVQEVDVDAIVARLLANE